MRHKTWLFTIFMTMILMFSLAGISSANTLSELLGNTVVPNSSTITDTSIQNDIADIVKKVRIIGAAISFVFAIIAGIKFSSSGSNDQKRTQAFMSLVGVAAGIFIIMQAASIVSWFSNFGA